MSRKLSGLITAFVTLVLVASSLSPAAASSPQISVVSISLPTVLIGQTVSVEYRITDDGQCCNPHDVYMYDSSGAWVTRVQGTRISGTDQNSVWRANFTVPVNSEGQNYGTALTPGTYSFKTQTTDLQNNYSDLVLLGTISAVTGAAAPQISLITLSARTLTEPGNLIRVTYRITDDYRCCNPHDVYMYDPNGAWVTRVQGRMISGTGQDSTWRADITVPVNSVGQNYGTALITGTYSFRTQTTDLQNNYSALVLLGTVSIVIPTPSPSPSASASASPSPSPSASASASPSPSPSASAPSGPQISVVSLSKSSLSRGDSIRVEYRITDDGACCNPHDVYVYDPNGAWVTRVQGTRISGTDSNSLWGANISIPVNSVGQNMGSALTAGRYSFRTQTTDAQNNFSDLVLLGTVSVVVASSTPAPSPAPSPSSTAGATPGATTPPSEEIDLEPEEEEYEPSIEAKFSNGRTRIVVNGNPNTKYKVEATLRGNKKTFTITTDSDGELIFRTKSNLKNYNIRLILGKVVLASAKVQ